MASAVDEPVTVDECCWSSTTRKLRYDTLTKNPPTKVGGFL